MCQIRTLATGAWCSPRIRIWHTCDVCISLSTRQAAAYARRRLHFGRATAWVCSVAACGGGNEPVSTPAPGDTSANVFASLAGSYASGCVVYQAASGPSSASSSEESSATVSNLAGTDKATVSLRNKFYSGSENCAPATLDTDVTIGGQVTHRAATKVVSGTVANPKSGTAQIGEFRYDSLTLSKGSLNIALPTFGTTAQVAYLVEGSKVFVISGSRSPDGLGSRFSNTVMTRQQAATLGGSAWPERS